MAFEFDRYINGQLMAEGVTIERQDNLPDAMRAAARIASRGPNGEVPVLVHRAEALSRTGAVKDGLVEFAKEMCRIGFDGGSINGCDILDTAVEHGLCKVVQFSRDMKGIAHSEYLEEGDAVYVFTEALASHPRATSTVDAHETANVNDKPEGQQPVVSAVRVCPVRDAICPHGMGCLYNDGMDCDMEASRADLAYQKHAAPYTRPSEQAVTEAMVDVAARAIANAWGETWECCCTAKRGLDCDCGDAMVEERDGYDERLSRDDCRMAARAALKAAMEAGHD